MVQGFVIPNHLHRITFVSQWAEGTPTLASFLRLWFVKFGIEAPKSGEKIPIGTFRCASCGYLESYAREEFAAK